MIIPEKSMKERMGKMKKEEIKKEIERKKLPKKKKVVQNLLKAGFSLEKIAEITKLTIEDVMKIKEELEP